VSGAVFFSGFAAASLAPLLSLASSCAHTAIVVSANSAINASLIAFFITHLLITHL
jgi:NCAIR mutase (PurE)-related protein